ncbi:immunity 42 family protein [Erwinia amylovora]|uniref:immunity 42 family protein n=1 Tax=Erwinia amylovora TaxID=552 RepID=UPI0014441FA3|nr:immunity 42 family protein [Erwinia amylovora]
MIFGDPYRFAVLIQHIPDWSDETYKNGLFHFCIDGDFFPNEISTSTLWVDVYSLIDESNPLISFKDDENLFVMDKDKAFTLMLGMISPELIGLEETDDFEPSCIFQASTENINDAGFMVFSVSNKDSVRILGAKYNELKQDENGNNYWSRIFNPNVKESVLAKKEINEIMTSVITYHSKIK